MIAPSRRAAMAALAMCAATLAGCAQSEPRTETNVEQASASSAGSPAATVYAHGDVAHHFESFEDMATVDVVIAKVVADRDGVVAPEGDGEHPSYQLRRVITVEVTDTLAGAGLTKNLDIQTLGWVVEDGRRTPLTLDGMPWLQVGDEAVIALDDPNNAGEPGFASDAAVQVFRDGRIAAAPVSEGSVAPPLSHKFEGMTKTDIVKAFSEF